MNWRAVFDELEKLGTVTPQEARRSLDRLDQIEKDKPTAGQVARYGLLGAGTGALTKGLGSLIEHGELPTARGALGGATIGAIGMGALPLVRQHLDRRAEYNTLKRFMEEYASSDDKTAEEKLKKEKDADSALDFNAGYDPGSFSVSQYSGPLTYGPWILPSLLSYTQPQSLETTVERKKQAASLMPTTPASPKTGLTAARKVGQPKLTAPSGPSIADVAKPQGFGLALPGAKKGLI